MEKLIIILNLPQSILEKFENSDDFQKLNKYKLFVLSDAQIDTGINTVSEDDFLETIENMELFRNKRLIHNQRILSTKNSDMDNLWEFYSYPMNLITYSESDAIIIVENRIKKIIVNEKGLNLVLNHIDELLKVNSSNKRIILDNYITITNKVEYYNLDINNVTIVAAVTKEISYRNVSRLVKSAAYNGYALILEDRNEKWRGFGTKIKCLLKGLQSLDDSSIAILIDSTDTFITRPDLLEVYKKFGSDIVVSGERKLWYNNKNKSLKYPESDIENFFKNNIKGRDIFPNAGFFMGKVKYLKSILEQISNCDDDQYAFINLLYESKKISNNKIYIGNILVSVDTESQLIGTIANYLVKEKQDISPSNYSKLFLPGSRSEIYDFATKAAYSNPTKRINDILYRGYRIELDYKYDLDGYRIGNVYPGSFHYPNKNNDVFNLMYAQVYDDIIPISSNSENSSMWYWIILAVILVLIIVSILFIVYAMF